MTTSYRKYSLDELKKLKKEKLFEACEKYKVECKKSWNKDALAEEIYNKLNPDKSNKLSCDNFDESKCKKFPNYTRKQLNKLAEDCGVENPADISSRDKLCEAIAEQISGSSKSRKSRS